MPFQRNKQQELVTDCTKAAKEERMERDWCVELGRGQGSAGDGVPTPPVLPSPLLSIRHLAVMFGLEMLFLCRQ